MKGEEASAAELEEIRTAPPVRQPWRGASSTQLQVPAWQGEGSSVGSNVLPPLPSPSREIRVGSHEKGGKESIFV